MNEFKVLTVRDVEFTDDSGKLVRGMQIWACGESDENGWNGWEVIKIWVPDGGSLEDVAAALKHDDIIRVDFNRRGKATKIDIVG